MIKIVGDKMGQTVRVFSGDTELGGITKIEFEPMIFGQPIAARLTFALVSMELNAKAIIESTEKAELKPDA